MKVKVVFDTSNIHDPVVDVVEVDADSEREARYKAEEYINQNRGLAKISEVVLIDEPLVSAAASRLYNAQTLEGRRWAKQRFLELGYDFLGEGCGRVVFSPPDHEDKVLKVAKRIRSDEHQHVENYRSQFPTISDRGANGKSQNQSLLELHQEHGDIPILPSVYSHGQHWVLVERVDTEHIHSPEETEEILAEYGLTMAESWLNRDDHFGNRDGELVVLDCDSLKEKGPEYSKLEDF